MAELLPLAVLFFLLLTSSSYSKLTTANSHHHHLDNHTDLSSLLSFKSHVADPTRILASNWTTNTSFCNWFGISCSRKRQRVTSIDLRDVPLHGTISPHLANLSFLSILDVGNCSLTGHIPDQLAYLRRISKMVLQQNWFSGHIPSGIFNISSLRILSVAYNNLTGSIPVIMLPRLQFISLSANQLTGAIPSSFANCRQLQTLSLSINLLSGTIPAEFANFPALILLYLGGNSLSGHIPSSIFNISSLKAFYVSDNNLTGSIPVIMLPRLERISLSDNQLTGAIPSSFTNCKQLQILSLSGNLLSGTLPTEFGNFSALIEMWLGGNRLTGTIPTSTGNLSNLVKLDLSWNMLEGTIPGELGGLSVLSRLYLGLNNLTGPIPTALLNASNVDFLSFVRNKLTGTIPVRFGESMPLLTFLNLENNRLTGGFEFLTSLSSCRDLEFLSVSDNLLEGALSHSVGNLSEKLLEFRGYNNHITGNIPKEFSNLSSLIILELEMNELTGGIPANLVMLWSLQVMVLSSNQLSGTIPVDIGLMTGLNTLYLDKNALSGPIPYSLGNISGLQLLSLGANRLVSNIPNSLWSLRELIELNSYDNSLEGALPLQIGNLKNLILLNFFNNLLSDNIPIALGELVMLTTLDLSNNSFHGQIPQSFGGLINVEYVNLSHNFISGTIPKSIANLRYLSTLDLSFNRLEGPIPEGRVFSNLSIPSLIGNEGLCGAPNLSFALCSSDTDTSRSKQNLHILKYVLPAVAFTATLLASFYLLFKHRRKESKPSTDDASLADYTRISYHDIVNATENFSNANILGRGSVGTVFKAYIHDRLPVAVKVLNLEVQGALRSFVAECEALRMVRHRNLVKIISVCCNDDFKALILQFMSNGSLEKWLYSENYCLNILQRINIAIDVSQALEYLHHHHPYIVLHRDLKPSNVLMDEEMVAHVGDFGIAKLLHDESMSTMSANTPGTIGYMAPEYGSTGKVSRKVDVYSFGILLLEMCTRKRPTDAMFDKELNMREWVNKAYPNEVLEIIDNNLIREASSNEQETTLHPIVHQCLSSMIELGLMCSRELPKERLQMKDVVPKLQKIRVNYISMLPGQ